MFAFSDKVNTGNLPKIIYHPQTKLREVKFSHGCGGGGVSVTEIPDRAPPPHPPIRDPPDTDPPILRPPLSQSVYCSGRYSSYWNACLAKICFQTGNSPPLRGHFLSFERMYQDCDIMLIQCFGFSSRLSWETSQ